MKVPYKKFNLNLSGSVDVLNVKIADHGLYDPRGKCGEYGCI